MRSKKYNNKVVDKELMICYYIRAVANKRQRKEIKKFLTRSKSCDKLNELSQERQTKSSLITEQ